MKRGPRQVRCPARSMWVDLTDEPQVNKPVNPLYEWINEAFSIISHTYTHQQENRLFYRGMALLHNVSTFFAFGGLFNICEKERHMTAVQGTGQTRPSVVFDAWLLQTASTSCGGRRGAWVALWRAAGRRAAARGISGWRPADLETGEVGYWGLWWHWQSETGERSER